MTTLSYNVLVTGPLANAWNWLCSKLPETVSKMDTVNPGEERPAKHPGLFRRKENHSHGFRGNSSPDSFSLTSRAMLGFK